MTDDKIAYVHITDAENIIEVLLEAEDGLVLDENGETIITDLE
jgi:hypothetical protein